MKAIHLTAYPDGPPTPAHFALADEPDPVPGEGEVLVQVLALGMDPAVRMRMSENSRMGPPLALDAAVAGRGVGRVLASRHRDFAPGDLVGGELGWRERGALAAAALERLAPGAHPPHAHLNALGPTGLAAWFAIEQVAPRAGETIVIAPAAGAVGSLAAQLARNLGARVIGLARGEAQLAYLRTLGVESTDAEGDLAPLAPGVDIFIDGVGGPLHDRVLSHLAPKARVLLIGCIAGYNDAAPPRYGNAARILFRRATMAGFLLADHMPRAAHARAALDAAISDGTLEPAETVWRGLEQAPHAFAALFADAPPGKQIVILEDSMAETSLTYGEVPRPQIMPHNEVLVEVHATSVNPFETKLRRGWFAQLFPVRPPHILGQDVAGTIAEKGFDVAQYEIGQRVWGLLDPAKPGTYAEYVGAPSYMVRPMPSNLSFE